MAHIFTKIAEHSSIMSTFPVSMTPYVDATQHLVATQQLRKNECDESSMTIDSHNEPRSESRFMDALIQALPAHDTDLPEGKMLTANGDVAFQDSGEPIVDLFQEMEENIDADRLKTLLEKAWASNPNTTLRLIWNSRSIHLGKSNRMIFYRAVGWLAQTHPITLLENLQWVVRSVIRIKVPKPASPGNTGDKIKDERIKDVKAGDTTHETEALQERSDSDYELIEADPKVLAMRPSKRAKSEESEAVATFGIRYGGAHGYWKDLLNILTLSATGNLNVNCQPRDVFNDKTKSKKYERDWTPGAKRARLQARHEAVVKKLENDPFHRALHMRVAKLFADQLRIDSCCLQSGDKARLKRISLAAKWAPSNRGSHDEHTFIVSTIAELLHPFDSACPAGTDLNDRELCLRFARAAYQSKTLSPLRKHIDIVERHLTDGSFHDIKYDRLPSQALRQYTGLFHKKDEQHFTQYITAVAQGRARISGATLLPSTMVAAARQDQNAYNTPSGRNTVNTLVASKTAALEAMVPDGQWKTLVQRIKDSGTMESSIAVCDVSGSMAGPYFPDKSTPMDSSIGLSLLLAEVCKPPFGGAFITFHERPEVMQVGGEQDQRTFSEKVQYIQRAPWWGSTDFRAVFEKLILPMAKKHKLKQEDMVKRVFVFSDMHFNAASGERHHNFKTSRWSSSYKSIQKSFRKAGYEMPELVFWNLAGSTTGDGTSVPKPVDAFEEGTALVSGYSQAMLKVFLEGGHFDKSPDPVSFDGDAVVFDEQGNEVESREQKMTPLAIVQKAICHDAYRMLEVVD